MSLSSLLRRVATLTSAALLPATLIAAELSNWPSQYLIRPWETARLVVAADRCTVADTGAPAATTASVTSIDSTFELVTVTDSTAAPARRFARVRISAL